jgi:hypothetical protein
MEGILPAPKAAAGEGRMRSRTQATRNSDPPKVEVEIAIFVRVDCLTAEIIVGIMVRRGGRHKKIRLEPLLSRINAYVPVRYVGWVKFTFVPCAGLATIKLLIAIALPRLRRLPRHKQDFWPYLLMPYK